MFRQVRTVIVGAGFGGVSAAYNLKQQGQDDFVILERGDRVGGVWRANTYPGITCDVPSHAYSLSFAPNPRWTKRFSPGDEIQAYLVDVIRTFDLEKHLQIDTDVVRAALDETRGRWHIELRNGAPIEAEVLITACGQLSRPRLPTLPGLGEFEGRWFHSAEWPEDVRFEGKRVAVVGTGASAIQFAPAIAPLVRKMKIFQRSAPWIIAKPDTTYSAPVKWLYTRFPILQQFARRFWQAQLESLVPVFTRKPPMRARFVTALFRALAGIQRFVQLRGDRQLIAATTPDHPLGCKRTLLTNQWYPLLRRANVELVTEAVKEVVGDGVIAHDGRHHEADIIVFGTGFATTEFLAPMEVVGRGHASLKEVWKDGAEAYLGIGVPKFPNMFLLYGPNTNHGTGSAVDLIEMQARYAAQAVASLARDQAECLEVRGDVHDAFRRELDERLKGTIWARGCRSWYVTETGRITNNWPGSLREYKRRTSHLNLDDYQTKWHRREQQPQVSAS